MIFNYQKILKFIQRRKPILKRIFNLNKSKLKTSIMDDHIFKDIPLIVILGETGVGKTKLAVELSRRFNGEVISADSMQIYEGLDIITNKVTKEESAGVPHHMINILKPSSANFNVQTFRNRALKIINETWTIRRALPVVVGGTNYYIEALLWNRLVNDLEYSNEIDEDDDAERDDGDPFLKDVPFDINSMTDEQLHEELRQIDPIAADRRHPNNRRRVIRSIQIYYSTGRRHSDWLNEQHLACGANILGGPLRFGRLCIFWLTCDDRSILKERLNRRVDEMVVKGLKEEIIRFYDLYFDDWLRKYGNDATTKGILQSIGLKEFEQFLKLPKDQRYDDRGSKLFDEGVEKLKLVTYRYAKKQRQWITNRFYRLAARDSISIYRFDLIQAEKWPEIVSEPAERIVQAFLDGRKSDIKPVTISSLENSVTNNEWSAENRYCDICRRLICGLQWTEHVKSKRHILEKCRKNKKEKFENNILDSVQNISRSN